MSLAEPRGLYDWLGRTETVEDDMGPFPAHALAATLDQPPPETIVPPLWHWLYFLTPSPLAETGRDGHAKRGGFLPPVALPRRMWAGGRLKFGAGLEIGKRARRTSTIESIAEKNGRSGELAFVKVRHVISQSGRLAIDEEHDIVYRDSPRPLAVSPAETPAPPDHDWQGQVVPTSLMLFRYSALTFNGHRIHYDHPYAVDVEGYAGLVVHGPLIATLLADQAWRRSGHLRSFSYRAVRPAIAGEAIKLCGRASSDTEMELWAKDNHNRVIMTAVAQTTKYD